MADNWFCVTESTCFRCKVVHFKDENANTWIRMEKTVMKIVIWGGKSLFLWSDILFYSHANAELLNECCDHNKPMIYLPKSWLTSTNDNFEYSFP